MSEREPTPSPLVTIGIVNWNCGRFLPRCLASVAAQSLQEIEIILVDNGSTDGSVEWVARHYASVQILRNPANLGFARAQNQAIARAHGEFYMPLNPDVELDGRFVEEMVAALQGKPDYGYASGLVYFLTGNPRMRHVVYSSGHLLVRNGHAYNRFEIVHRSPDAFEEGEVGGASGVCPLYRKQMLDDLAVEGAVFDPGFFLYMEDVDLDWRAHLAGWKCWFTPRALAWHVMEGTGAAPRTRIRAQIAANRWLMIVKNLDIPLIARCLPYMARFDLSRTLPMLARRPGALPLALWNFLRGLPRALRHRRRIRGNRRLTPSRIYEWMERNRAELRRTTRLAESAPRPMRRHGRLTWPDA